MHGEVQRRRYADLDERERHEIARLQDLAYGPPATPTDSPAPLHDPALQAWSFLLRRSGRLVSYAGVVTTTMHAGGNAYLASGLSCVATDPAAARQGFASLVVAAATRHIEDSSVDLGVFTCAPALVPLYEKAGGWEAAPGAVLIGSRDPGALTSTALGVVVLLRFFSKRAIDNAASLRHGTLDLGLPTGQFW